MEPRHKKIKKCASCSQRPDITEDGTFYCTAVDEWVNDDDYICGYFKDGR